MKKNVITFVLAAFMTLSTVECMAADTIYRPDDNGSYTLEYTDEKIVDGESYGFVVIEGLGSEILDLSDDNFESILYIDEAVAENGSVSFNSFGLRGTQPAEDGFVGGTAFIGGEGFESATTVGTLQAAEDPVVPVESITLDQTTATVLVGETITLAATVKPDDATDKTVIWESLDSTVASVDQNGVVTGVSANTTPVEIRATAGDKVATCMITVSSSAIGERIAGDADGDGEVTVGDAVRICQYLVGYNVTLN